MIALLTLLFGACRHEPLLTSNSPEDIRLYQDGLAQYEKFYYSEALATFQSATAADSSFAMAWTRLAIVQQAVRNEVQARRCIERALRVSSEATQREQLFVRMWYHRLNFDSQGAAASADSLVKLFPAEKEAYLFRGSIFEQEKNYDAAIRWYQKAVQADTGYALAVMTLGYAYSAVGEQEKAIAMMQRYISLEPGEPDPRASYADLLMRAGRYGDALAQYQQSLRIKQDYWYSIREIGRIYAIQGRLRAAESQYLKSFESLPQNSQLGALRNNLDAGLNVARGNDVQAVLMYQKGLAEDSLNLDAAYGLTAALARLGRYREAREVAVRIDSELGHRELLSSPTMGQLLVLRSIIAMHEGKLPEALALCDSAITFSTTPTRGGIYRQMAEVMLRQRAYEQALGACEDGLAASPNSPDILLTLARIYHAKGDLKMTAEIGGRLLDLWHDADSDFRSKQEVIRLVGAPH
jgi:tetratricopeptide (TPR) repeat protein